VAEVRARVQIRQLVEQSGVELRKVGKRWVGKCPFHDDRTPSFDVSPEKGLFGCWTCGESGNCYDWVMKTTGMGFRDTHEYLAAQVGVSTNGATPSTFDENAFREAQAQAKAERDKLQQKEWQRIAAECAKRFEAAGPADPAHPYLQAKGIVGDLPTSWIRQEGEHLLIPMRGPVPSKDISSLQVIGSDGVKLNTAGGRAKGCRVTIYDPPLDRTGAIYLCEGWATGHTIHTVTGCPVVVAFSQYGIREVGPYLVAECPDAEIIIAADNDRRTAGNPGVEAARAVAEETRCSIAIPDFPDEHLDVPEGEKGPNDFNDLFQLAGADAVRRWLDPELAGDAITVAEPEPAAPAEATEDDPAEGDPEGEEAPPEAAEDTEEAEDEEEPEPVAAAAEPAEDGVRRGDFFAYMVEHKFIYTPTGDLWPASSVDARIPPVQVNGERLKASKWLDQHRPVEQMTWYPGEPSVIEDRLVAHGGWIARSGVRCFNLYRPPTITPGDPAKAGPWLEHIGLLFPESAEHIARWFAQRVQQPHVKINHCLVLIGPQGTGKDTIVEGPIPAVGHWNCWEVGPEDLMGRFNPHVKSVILRVSEARDLGDMDRYRLYERLKVLAAAPPDVLRVDEKNRAEYMVPNVLGVVITSNHMDGIYLPGDDRRHYVAATELTKEDFTEAYWNGIYHWYEHEGGFEHVAAYLHALDLSGFNPKAPPPKTAAFRQVVDAGRAPEDAELADALDRLGWPDAVSLRDVARVADTGFAAWLGERKNRRQIPHRMHEVDYAPVRNDAAKDGRWKVEGKRQVLYAKRDLSIRDRLAAARRLVESAG